MTEKQLLQALGNVDGKYTTEAEERAASAVRRKHRKLPIIMAAGAAAACLGIVFFGHLTDHHDDFMIANSNVSSGIIEEQEITTDITTAVTEHDLLTSAEKLNTVTTRTDTDCANDAPAETNLAVTVPVPQHTTVNGTTANIPADTKPAERTVTEDSEMTTQTQSDDTNTNKSVLLRFEVPVTTDCHYHIVLYKDGIAACVGGRFNPLFSAGMTCLTAEGSGSEVFIAVLFNDETNAEATIGAISIDFDNRTYEMLTCDIAAAFSAVGGTPEWNYITQVMECFLTDYHAEPENVWLSAGYRVVDLKLGTESGKRYFVISNDTVIGMLTVGYHDGEYSSCYIATGLSVLQQAYDAHAEIALYTQDEAKLWLYNKKDNTVCCLYGWDDEIRPAPDSLDKSALYTENLAALYRLKPAA